MLKYFKDKKIQAIKKENERIAESKKKAEKTVKESTDLMLNSWCPIFNGNCQKRCIHFNEGHIFDMTWDILNYYHKKSTCKLWS